MQGPNSASMVSGVARFRTRYFGALALIGTKMRTTETHRDAVAALGRNVVIGRLYDDGFRRGNPDTVDAESTTAAMTTGTFDGAPARFHRSRTSVCSTWLIESPYAASIITVRLAGRIRRGTHQRIPNLQQS